MEAYVIVRQIHTSEIDMVCKAIRDAFFPPKRSWRKPLYEMAYKGLISHKWTGIGLFTKQKDLIAYCDYKQKNDTSIEIGICLTIQKYRNHGYMQTLFQFLFNMYPEYSIRIGTYENNTAMIHCINRSGFQEEQRIANDRIDGTSTIYYVRKGVVTGGTEHHYALHENNGSGECYSVVE